MSFWLTDLAGKAEGLLNNLDSSAAATLRTGSGSAHQQLPMSSAFVDDNSAAGSTPVPHHVSVVSEAASLQRSTSRSTTPIATTIANAPVTTSSSQQGRESPMVSRVGAGSTEQQHQQQPKEDDLFELLSNPPTAVAEDSVAPSATSTKTHSRTSSSSMSILSKFEIKSGEVSGDNGDSTNGHRRPQSTTLVSTSNVTVNQSTPTAPSSNDKEATLQRENSVLRSEISSLNEEISSLLVRYQSMQSERGALQKQSEEISARCTQLEQMVSAMRNNEQDLIEKIAVKESQIAAIKVRLMEVDSARDELQNEVGKLRRDNESILHDHSASSDVQNHVLDDLKNKLTVMEDEMSSERYVCEKLRQDNDDLKARVEEFKMRNAEMLTAQTKIASDDRRKVAELHSELSGVRSKYEQLQREHVDYKEKATKILQMKENLVNSLKTASATEEAGSSARAELEALQHERDMLREEIRRRQVEHERFQAESQETETHMHEELQNIRSGISAAEAQYNQERAVRTAVDEELAQLKREGEYIQEKLRREKTEIMNRIHEKDQTIDKLRNQLTIKSSSGNNQAELENRIRNLTENLIQKQSVIEAVAAEKQSLVMRLENTERQLQMHEQIQSHSGGQSVQVDPTDTTETGGGGLRQRDYIKINMQDQPFTKNVKRAVNSLDKIGIRFSVFLRRYPAARLFILLYVFVLHFWVMVVLLTYQPEMHGKDFAPSAPKVPNVSGK